MGIGWLRTLWAEKTALSFSLQMCYIFSSHHRERWDKERWVLIRRCISRFEFIVQLTCSWEKLQRRNWSTTMSKSRQRTNCPSLGFMVSWCDWLAIRTPQIQSQLMVALRASTNVSLFNSPISVSFKKCFLTTSWTFRWVLAWPISFVPTPFRLNPSKSHHIGARPLCWPISSRAESKC